MLDAGSAEPGLQLMHFERNKYIEVLDCGEGMSLGWTFDMSCNDRYSRRRIVWICLLVVGATNQQPHAETMQITVRTRRPALHHQAVDP